MNENEINNKRKMGDISVSQENNAGDLHDKLDKTLRQGNYNKLSNSGEMGNITISQKNDSSSQPQAALPLNLSQNNVLETPRDVVKPGDTLQLKDVPRCFPIVGVIFTFITVLSLLYLLLGPQDISSGKHVIFDVWVAICVAASASFIGGSARANGNFPWPAWLGGNTPPIQFATAGGFAVFVIALLILLNAYH